MSQAEDRDKPALWRPVHDGPPKVILTGKGCEALRDDLTAADIRIVETPHEADAVVVYGGDGSLLGADREFPSHPKMIIRRNSEFIKCEKHLDRVVFERLRAGEQTICKLPRLEARLGDHRISAINDIVIHNAKVTAGVRCLVRVDGELYENEVVGDGLVVATPFGSSAYYRSITKSVIRVGMGLAFNNSTESVNHLVLSEYSTIEVEITRGPAVMVSDNMLDPIPIDRGDVIRIGFSKESAEIWEIETLLCKKCWSRKANLPAGFRHI